MEEEFKEKCKEQIKKLDEEAKEIRGRLRRDKYKLESLTKQKRSLQGIIGVGSGRKIDKPKKEIKVKEETKNETEPRV